MIAEARRLVFVIFAIAVTGCATFQPKPLVPQDVLRQLQEIRVETLRPVDTVPPTTGPQPGTFDTTDGLSATEAVAVALFLNPDIRAFRRERGVAEGELIAARLLPNPELQLTWMYIENFTRSLATGGVGVSLNWAPPRPGERSARIGRAEARIGSVHAQIAQEEWRLAAEVRKAYVGLWAAQGRLRLVGAAVALQERLLRFLRDKRELGDASRLEVNLLELEYVERRRELQAILNEEQRARLEFNRIVGLPPQALVPLQGPDPLTYRPVVLSPPEQLEPLMVERRPDVAAVRYDYEQVQQELRLAYIQRIPWFRFGPAYSREEGTTNEFGIGIGIDLPIANLNQGEIARLEAAREKVRESFVARVHAARAEVNDALRAVRAQERLVRLYEDVVRPALEESARLTDAAVALGDVNILQFVTAQDKVLRSRRDFIDTQLEYWRSLFELERAVGALLPELEGGKP